jgi:hypothetical protein
MPSQKSGDAPLRGQSPLPRTIDHHWQDQLPTVDTGRRECPRARSSGSPLCLT